MKASQGGDLAITKLRPRIGKSQALHLTKSRSGETLTIAIRRKTKKAARFPRTAFFILTTHN